jgi:prephenate dehydrogenase
VAGKEITGAAAADEELYRNRRVIVTPSARSAAEAIAKLETLWRATGANVEQMTPEAHDAILARASHLPQIASSALAVTLANEMVDGKWAAGFGAGGLRDTTRIAASSAEMWRDICLTNREAISATLELYKQSINDFSRAVESGDAGRLIELFERGRRMRERLK